MFSTASTHKNTDPFCASGERPRACALPVADEAQAQSVPGSTIDAALRGKERVGHPKRAVNNRPYDIPVRADIIRPYAPIDTATWTVEDAGPYNPP